MAFDVNFINAVEVATITLNGVDLGATLSAYTFTVGSERQEINIQQSAFPVKKFKTQATASSEFSIAQDQLDILQVIFDQAAGNLVSPTLTIDSDDLGEVAFVATGADQSMGTLQHPVINMPQSVVEGDTSWVFDRNAAMEMQVQVSHLADSAGTVGTIVATND
jgi:hypothetical protein